MRSPWQSTAARSIASGEVLATKIVAAVLDAETGRARQFTGRTLSAIASICWFVSRLSSVLFSQ